MSYGDPIDGLSDLHVHDLDQDGIVDAVSMDTDGNGFDDAGVMFDADSGDYALHSVDEADGSTVTLLYDSSGAVISAAFGDPSGAITEISGPDIMGFLADFGEYTGTEVPLEAPTDRSEPPVDVYDQILDRPDDISVAQVPIDPTGDDYTSVDDVTGSPAYEDWAASNPDGVIGDVTDADFWFQQSTDYTCGPAAATQIVEDFTGTDLGDEGELTTWADENDLLSENGMLPDDLATTLTHFGVPSKVVEDQSWDDVAGYLEEGRSVVMMVDGGDYWRPGNDLDRLENADDDTVNHFVRIVGIDTERNVAILSDSGASYGQLLEVPLDTMEDAWNDVTSNHSDGTVERGHLLVVSDSSDPTGEDPAGSPLTDFGASQVNDRDDQFDERDLGLTTSGLDSAASPLTDFQPAASGSDAGAVADDDGWVSKVFANPAGWALVPITLAASRIFATRR